MIIKDRIPSRLELLSGSVSGLIEKIKVFGLTEDQIINIRLCLEEAVVNAIRHGNRLNPNLSVDVTIEIEDGKLSIEIKDQGEGFDFGNLADPTHEENLTKSSGRGIFLIKKLMDKVEFFDCGRRIKMIKFLK